jgi:hypothetical protein
VATQGQLACAYTLEWTTPEDEVEHTVTGEYDTSYPLTPEGYALVTDIPMGFHLCTLILDKELNK